MGLNYLYSHSPTDNLGYGIGDTQIISPPNGGTSPTVFDFQSHYQGTAPKIPAQVTITRYTITAVPLSLTLTIPSSTLTTNPTQNPTHQPRLPDRRYGHLRPTIL